MMALLESESVRSEGRCPRAEAAASSSSPRSPSALLRKSSSSSLGTCGKMLVSTWASVAVMLFAAQLSRRAPAIRSNVRPAFLVSASAELCSLRSVTAARHSSTFARRPLHAHLASPIAVAGSSGEPMAKKNASRQSCGRSVRNTVCTAGSVT